MSTASKEKFFRAALVQHQPLPIITFLHINNIQELDFPARAWLDIRGGKDDATRFYNGKPERGVIVVLWSLFYDFHSLMNNEIIDMHNPVYGDPRKFGNLTAQEMGKIDGLARLMLDPDANFDALKEIFETQRDFRLLTGALLR